MICIHLYFILFVLVLLCLIQYNISNQKFLILARILSNGRYNIGGSTKSGNSIRTNTCTRSIKCILNKTSLWMLPLSPFSSNISLKRMQNYNLTSDNLTRILSSYSRCFPSSDASLFKRCS